MPRARSLNDVIELRRRERDADGDRYVDLRLDFEFHPERHELDGTCMCFADTLTLAARDILRDAELEGRLDAVAAIRAEFGMLAVGDRWDRRANAFDGEAETGKVIRFHEGQRAAVEWFVRWLDRHEERRANPAATFDPKRDVPDDEVYSALFAGGRRGGKTWIGVAFAIAYAIRFPGAIVWLVSPSHEKHDELRRYVAEFVHGSWLDGETLEGWELVNGSRLLLKSAFGTGDSLKEGKADFVVMNEGQKMNERAFVVCRGAIVDSSGLVLVCANPPVDIADQQWVTTFATDAMAHRRAAVYLHFSPLLNPHTDRAALLALAQEVDLRTYQVEVLGMFLPPRDAVVYNWIRIENELPTPNARWDVTERFMEVLEEGLGIKQVVGLDVQRIPYIGGPVYRFFGKPTVGDVLMWGIDEVVLDGGDEEEFCEALLDKGYLPDETLIVCDASGRYQHSRRRAADAPPPEWKGRGSFDIIRRAGFHRIVPPDRRAKRNPEIADRVRALTSLVASDHGAKRRLFFDPDGAPRACKAIREWKAKNGSPSRSQYEAHLGDGVSYPVIRFFPRRLRFVADSGNPPGVITPATAALPPIRELADAELSSTRTERAPRRGRSRRM